MKGEQKIGREIGRIFSVSVEHAITIFGMAQDRIRKRKCAVILIHFYKWHTFHNSKNHRYSTESDSPSICFVLVRDFEWMLCLCCTMIGRQVVVLRRASNATATAAVQVSCAVLY